MEDAMQAKISELKKRQEALRKGLENMAKEKHVQNTDIVKNMDVNTTQLDSASIQELINTIMPQDDVGEGCSGSKGPDEGGDSDSEQEVALPVDSESDLSGEEGCSGARGEDEEAESDRAQEVNPNVDSESDFSAEEGYSGSGAKGQEDEEAESEQEDIRPSDGHIVLSDPSEESSENDYGSDHEYSSDDGDHSPNRKRAKMD